MTIFKEADLETALPKVKKKVKKKVKSLVKKGYTAAKDKVTPKWIASQIAKKSPLGRVWKKVPKKQQQQITKGGKKVLKGIRNLFSTEIDLSKHFTASTVKKVLQNPDKYAKQLAKIANKYKASGKDLTTEIKKGMVKAKEYYSKSKAKGGTVKKTYAHGGRVSRKAKY